MIAWPNRIEARGEIRHQYAHAIDMVPTTLDLLNIEPPAEVQGVPQSPIEGVSFAHTLDDPNAPTNHTTQYFEMFGHRAIDHDGWRAVCPWPGSSFSEGMASGHKVGDEITTQVLHELDTTRWELYHITEDPTESTNLAAENREKLIELITLWYVEAGRHNVLPIDGTMTQRLAVERPQTSKPRTQFVYYPNGAAVPAFAAPMLYNRPHSIEAEVDIPESGAEGALVAQGGAAGGYIFYMSDDGRLRYGHNYSGLKIFEVATDEPVPAGKHTLRFEFEPTGKPDFAKGLGAPGRLELYVDGTLAGAAEASTTTPLFFELEGLSCGYDSGAPVLKGRYTSPFRFTGDLKKVTFDVGGGAHRGRRCDIPSHDGAPVTTILAVTLRARSRASLPVDSPLPPGDNQRTRRWIASHPPR